LQSHALHFFYLASPDLLLGMDSDPAMRNVVGVIAAAPDLARKGVRLRAFGQRIIAMMGEKRVHPNAAIPGGMNRALQTEQRDEILSQVDEAIADCQIALDLLKGYCAANTETVATFANFPSAYLGLVDDRGNIEYYDGKLRLKDRNGFTLEDIDPADYLSIIEEMVEDWSYLKFPYYKKLGYPGGMYRVGPLGRFNVADGCTTPLANKEFHALKKATEGKMLHGSMYYHYTRLIEMLNCAEEIKVLTEDKLICSKDIWVDSRHINEEGVGVIEAPRGTLMHHYWVDESGKMLKLNLIVATGHNNLAMNRAVYEVARQFIKDGNVSEGILNRIEVAIRCYDPCLSCASHAIDEQRLPLEVTIYSADGEIRKIMTN